MKTFIIAEAGSCHQKDWQIAKQLVKTAHMAKCNAIKFQTFSSDTLYSKYTPDFAGHKNIPILIKSLELPRHWQKELKKVCDDTGIEFMSTPFDEQAIDELVSIGVKKLKVAGFESTDFRFLRLVASTKLPLIVSLGIGCDYDERKEIIHCILDENPLVDLTVLHCNNCYPTSFEDINLGTMQQIYEQLDSIVTSRLINIGLSDHTEGILIPPVAVAMGATTIEKHFTLDKNLPGPDHSFSIEPDELKQMVDNIRKVEKSIGFKTGKLTSGEKNFSQGRRSVFAKEKIYRGDVFTTKNITTKRPYIKGYVPAKDYEKILNNLAVNNIDIDRPLVYNKNVKL